MTNEGPMTLAPSARCRQLVETQSTSTPWRSLLSCKFRQLVVDIGMLLVFRFITGVLGSPALATGGASIGELYSPQKRALGIGVWDLRV